MADLQYIITVDESGFVRGIRNARRGTDELGDDLEKNANRGIAAFSRLEKVIAGAFTVTAIKNFVSEIIKVRGEFQQLEIAFETMLQSKGKADRLMAELIQFAGETPFGLKDAASAAKQLLAYGSSAENVTDELRMLGDVASGVSANIGDIVYLYGTLRTQGRAYAVDIRQFAGRGIPIYAELAKVLKVNVDRVNEMVSAGKVGFAEVEQAFRNMTAAGSQFGGLMEKQSQSILGQIEKLTDAWDVMLNDIGQANQGLIYDGIGALASLVENYEKVIEVITALVATYGAYRAALLVTMALEKLSIAQRAGVTASFALQYTQLVLLQRAQAAYNAVLAASPVAAFTVLIAALGTVIYSLMQTVDAATEAQNALDKVHEASQKTVASETRVIEQLISVLDSNTASAEQKKAAYDKLIDSTDGVLKGYTQEEIAAGKAKGAIDEYIKSVGRAVEAREAFSEFNRLQDELDELDRKGIKAVDTWTRLGQGFKNAFPFEEGRTWGEYFEELFSGEAASKRIVNQVRDAKKTAQDEIKKQFGDKWNPIISGTDDDKPGKTLPAERTVEYLEDQIKKQKELRDANSKTSKEYQEYQKTINDLEQEKLRITGQQTKEFKKQADERKKFLEDLVKLENEANRKSLTATEEQKQAIRDKYNEQRKAAAELGLGEGVVRRIDRSELRELGDQSFAAPAEPLYKTIDKLITLQKQKEKIICQA